MRRDHLFYWVLAGIAATVPLALVAYTETDSPVASPPLGDAAGSPVAADGDRAQLVPGAASVAERPEAAVDVFAAARGQRRAQVVAWIEHAIEWEGLDWDDGEIGAMARIAWIESRWNEHDQNPTTTAYGLYQFIDATWQDVGISKTNNPILQTIAAVRYVADRYDSPSEALRFHDTLHKVNGAWIHYY